jgi:hypothetical protein
MLLMTKRDLAIRERTLLLDAPHSPMLAVKTPEAVFGAEIVYH